MPVKTGIRLGLAPSAMAVLHEHAMRLYRDNRVVEAVPCAEQLVAEDGANTGYSILLASVLATIGHTERALALWSGLVARHPSHPRMRMRYAHALRTVGRRDDAVAAYRSCFDLPPMMGEAWWSLANMKSGLLDETDIARMRHALADEKVTGADRLHLEYALGRALEETGDYSRSWSHYAEGARQRRLEFKYDPEASSIHVDRMIGLFAPSFMSERKGFGCPDPAPIFIVGLPRAGSTLIEQMLSSHPLVEGTMELPEIANIARNLSVGREYRAAIAAATAADFARMGADYLVRAQHYRRTDRPYFIDKMPNNWRHVGLIHLILPSAKIIDSRRHPMATCFSAFKQHFAKGQNYSYDQTELGLFYRDYLRMMAHIDAVLPGRVYRVQYERLVEDTESELRRLLDYCGLTFDPACLRFHENDRAVRTASSEQVRRPIFREGLDHWRNYDPWLGSLRETLGTHAEPV